MHDEVGTLKRLIKNGNMSAALSTVESVERSLRATEVMLVERAKELDRLRTRFAEAQVDRHELERQCAAFRDWFVAHRRLEDLAMIEEEAPVRSERDHKASA